MWSLITFRLSQRRCRPQPSGTWYVSFNKMLASCGQIGNTSPAGGDGLGERGGQWLMPTPPSRRRAGGASGKVRREWIMYLLTFLRQFPWWSEKGNYSQRLSRTVMITNGKDAVEKDSCLYWATITSSYLNTSVHTGRTLWEGGCASHNSFWLSHTIHEFTSHAVYF